MFWLIAGVVIGGVIEYKNRDRVDAAVAFVKGKVKR